VSAPRVAVAIPAFNEADGIAGFLIEIERALSPHVEEVRLIVVDDASTDGTREAIGAVAEELACPVEMIVNPRNQGHGPSLMSAYRQALGGEPDYVLQVDGDGQFHGSDLRRVLVLLMDDAHAVCGVRRFRQDPWFRMRMTALLRAYVRAAFAVRARDAYCPLRGYDAALLSRLLSRLPEGCPIPNLYLTILAARGGVPLLEVDVSHRVRRGASAVGSTWGRGISPIPWRLLRFSVQALRDSLEFRRRALATQELVRPSGLRPVPNSAVTGESERSLPSGHESPAPTAGRPHR
jgi:glycosyltransferase involved in cell wall biosynthesis